MLACLTHSLGLSPEELDDLAYLIETDDDSSDAWDGDPEEPLIRRNVDGESPFGFASTSGLRRIVEERADDLMRRGTSGEAITTDGDESQSLYPSSRHLEWVCLDDVGFVIGSWHNENDSYCHYILDSWTPATDEVARRRVIADALIWFWGQVYTQLPIDDLLAHFEGDLRELTDYLLAYVLANPPEAESIRRELESHLEARTPLTHEEWEAVGCEPPSDEWWSAIAIGEAPPANTAMPAIRRLVGYYIVLETSRRHVMPEQE